MTPERAFRIGGRHPETGWRVRDWYCVVSVFTPVRCVHEGREIFGMRQLVADDMASLFVLAADVEPDYPTTLRSSRLIPFLERVFRERGNALKGVVISHSCWYSSLELELDDDTAYQGDFLKAHGLEFGPMPEADKEEIRSWGARLGLVILFDANQVPLG